MRTYVLALLLILQTLAACQWEREKGSPLTDQVVLASTGKQRPEPPQKQAANIIFQSLDNGQTWEDVSAGLPANTQVGQVYAQNGEVLLSAWDNGLYRQRPALVGFTWEVEDWLNKDENITGIFPGRSGPYVVSFSNGFFQKIPGTPVWKALHNTLRDLSVYSVLEMPDGALLVGCYSGVYKSTDEGNSWQRVWAGSPVYTLTAADGVLLAGYDKGLLRSTDGGEHWDAMLSGNGAPQKSGRFEGHFYAIFDGRLAGQRYDDPGVRDRLFTSADGGQTWQRVATDRLATKKIYDLEQIGDTFLCSTDTGIFRSSDQGKTWKLVRPASKDESAVLAVSGKVIYAVFRRGGC